MKANYSRVMLPDGSMVVRHNNTLPELQVGDRISVYRTSVRFFEQSLMFSGVVDSFGTFANHTTVSLHSDNGDKHCVWASPLMKVTKDV